MNIIDLDDRSIREAEKANLDLRTHTEKCAVEFLSDIEKLNIKREDHYPRASENIDGMLALVEKLMEKGYAYEKLRSVYFDISKVDDYGCLSHIDVRKVQAGKTVDLDDYEKDSPGDFTLLKRSTLSELKRGIYFKTRWGNVRPSWHLECAEISLQYLADTFDVHASGADVVFPHCENVWPITGLIRNWSWSGARKCPAPWIMSIPWRIWKKRDMAEKISDSFSSARITGNP
jgi:cysteinyl-tRNA synthetase